MEGYSRIPGLGALSAPLAVNRVRKLQEKVALWTYLGGKLLVEDPKSTASITSFQTEGAERRRTGAVSLIVFQGRAFCVY